MCLRIDIKLDMLRTRRPTTDHSDMWQYVTTSIEVDHLRLGACAPNSFIGEQRMPSIYSWPTYILPGGCGVI